MPQYARIRSSLLTKLVLGGAAASLPLAGAAQMVPQKRVGAEATPSSMPILVQAESGEAGEAGLAKVEDPNTVYAIQLALVDAHLHAALMAADAGLLPDALGLAGHPEAEVMDDLRIGFEARGIHDFSDDLYAYSDLIAHEADSADIHAAYDNLSQEIQAAMHDDAVSDRSRFDAMHALVKGAAIEFEAMTAATNEPDMIAGLEAQGFLAVARAMALELSQSDNEVTATAAQKAHQALVGAATLLDEANTPDPSILFAAAARVELAGLRVQ